MPKKVFRVAYAINYLTHAIFTLLCPAVLFIGGAWLLQNKCGWGNWVMIVGIVLGVLTGVFSFFRFILVSAKQLDPVKKKGAEQNDGRTDL